MDLDKARRAMDNCEEWRGNVEMAARFLDVEFMPRLLMDVTVAVAVAWHLVKE